MSLPPFVRAVLVVAALALVSSRSGVPLAAIVAAYIQVHRELERSRARLEAPRQAP